MNRLSILHAASTACLPILAFADTDQSNIRIEMQVVTIPEKAAIPLVTELLDETKIEAAYGKIQEMLVRGEATLVGWPIVTTSTGKRAVVEAIAEIRYPTAYAPPTVSFTPAVNTAETVKIEPKADVTHLAATPSEFETRNTGVTLEVEPVILPEGEWIVINLAAYHIRLDGFTKSTIGSSKTGVLVEVEQPKFSDTKSRYRLD